MKRRAIAFFSLVLGILILSALVLFNSLSGGERSLTHLGTTYWPILLLSAGLILIFILLSKKSEK